MSASWISGSNLESLKITPARTSKRLSGLSCSLNSVDNVADWALGLPIAGACSDCAASSSLPGRLQVAGKRSKHAPPPVLQWLARGRGLLAAYFVDHDANNTDIGSAHEINRAARRHLLFSVSGFARLCPTLRTCSISRAHAVLSFVHFQT